MLPQEMFFFAQEEASSSLRLIRSLFLCRELGLEHHTRNGSIKGGTGASHKTQEQHERRLPFS